MAVNYPDSTIASFDLGYFYYGCALPLPLSVLSLPSSCTITIKGYSDDAATQLVGQQTFTFSTDFGQTNVEMSKAVVNLKGLQRVKFSASGASAGLIDSVGYTVYGGKNW